MLHGPGDRKEQSIAVDQKGNTELLNICLSIYQHSSKPEGAPAATYEQARDLIEKATPAYLNTQNHEGEVALLWLTHAYLANPILDGPVYSLIALACQRGADPTLKSETVTVNAKEEEKNGGYLEDSPENLLKMSSFKRLPTRSEGCAPLAIQYSARSRSI